VITQCPLCIVEKNVEIHTLLSAPVLTPSGFAQSFRVERMPLAAWASLTSRVGAKVMSCYCPQCGITFHHPELFEEPGEPTPLTLPAQG
jgi:hypothetical protein